MGERWVGSKPRSLALQMLAKEVKCRKNFSGSRAFVRAVSSQIQTPPTLPIATTHVAENLGLGVGVTISS